MTVIAYASTLFGQNIFSDNIAGVMGLYHFYKMRDELHYTLYLKEEDKMESGSCLVFFHYRKKDNHLNLRFEIDNCTHKYIFPENQVSQLQGIRRISFLDHILEKKQKCCKWSCAFLQAFYCNF